MVAAENLALVAQRWQTELVVRLAEADSVVDLPMRPSQPRRRLMAVFVDRITELPFKVHLSEFGLRHAQMSWINLVRGGNGRL